MRGFFRMKPVFNEPRFNSWCLTTNNSAISLPAKPTSLRHRLRAVTFKQTLAFLRSIERDRGKALLMRLLTGRKSINSRAVMQIQALHVLGPTHAFCLSALLSSAASDDVRIFTPSPFVDLHTSHCLNMLCK